MAVKGAKSVKAALQTAWKDAPDNGVNIIEGVFQFKVDSAKYHETEKTVGMKLQYKVIGGNEEYVGETINHFDNLTTQQNMSFFKQKLQKLGIPIPEDFNDIEDGTVASQMEGLCFEGQVKIKDGFVNIYVNKLVDSEEEPAEEEVEVETEEASEESAEEEETEEVEEEETEEEETEEVEEEETEEGKDETEEEESEEEESEEEEETEEEEKEEAEEEGGFPEPEEVASLKMSEVKKHFKDLGVDVNNVVYTKKALETVSKYIYVEGFKPDPVAVKETMKVFKLKASKDPVANRKALKKHIKSLIEG